MKMISEPTFRDLVRDMPSIMDGVRPHLHKKHIVAAGFEDAEESADPFDDEKTLMVSEVIRIYWKPSKGEYSGENYEISDPRLIAMFKGLVPEYEIIPHAYVHDQNFVKVFNLIINAWIDNESKSSVDLHSYYSECQYYFPPETKAVDKEGAQGSSEKQNINPESKIDPSSCNSFSLTVGLGFRFNGQWYGVGAQYDKHALNEKQLRLIELLYESEPYRMNIKEVLAILRTEFTGVKFSSLSDLFRKSRKGPIKNLYGTLIKLDTSVVFLDIPQK